MAEPIRRGSVSTALYVGTCVGVAIATFAVALLWQNIAERKEEARLTVFPITQLTEDTISPAEWGKNYPRQYDGYRRTVDTQRTRHGGSEAFEKLDEDPAWRLLFSGYAFSVDYREERGHAYMLVDQESTKRVTQFKQPGACLHCHSSIIPAYRQAGREAGIPDTRPREQLMAGFGAICALPYSEARKKVSHPVSCVDCHDPKSMELRVTRPGFLNGIAALARSADPVPHLASIGRWRTGSRVGDYDPNFEASRQEMRSMVCGQCHVEYYFKGKKEKLLTYPWHNGLKMDQIETYYDKQGWKDWSHKLTGAPTLKAQHPEFEMWSQGIHARSGVACADCHMPYQRQGAMKISDHHVRSPMLNMARACQPCHYFAEEELRGRVEAIQDRTRGLMKRGEQAVVGLIRAIETASRAGATDAQLAQARQLHRKAEWRLDFVAAENSMGFHAPQEAARILAEAIDYGRQGEIAVARIPARAPVAAAVRTTAAR